MSCGLVSRIQAQVRGTNGRSLEDTVDPIIRMVAVGRLYLRIRLRLYLVSVILRHSSFQGPARPTGRRPFWTGEPRQSGQPISIRSRAA